MSANFVGRFLCLLGIHDPVRILGNGLYGPGGYGPRLRCVRCRKEDWNA